MDMTITELHGKMAEVLAGCADDAVKLDNGNAAAGVRLRKALQELKKLMQETRKTSIDVGKSGKSGGSTPAPGSAPPTCGEGRPASECCGGTADGIGLATP